MQLAAMTFNVRGSHHDDGDNDWPRRRTLNLTTIHKYAPDIVGFQEAQSGNLEAYAEELKDYDAELGLISIRQAANYHRVPVYWRHDRFECVDSGGFYLSETPDTWSLSWGASQVRAVTWVQLRALNEDAEFIVLNTHFPHDRGADLAREESARLVMRRLDALGQAALPRLVMADFNALPGSPAYTAFVDAGYVDTYTAAGHAQPVNTFHGFQGGAYPAAGLRLDWILAKDGAGAWRTLACDVIADEAPPLYPSDHYPVLARLELL